MIRSTDFGFDISEFGELHSVAKNIKDIVRNRDYEIEVDSVINKICVSRPYFSFKKMYRFKNIIIAPIDREQPIGFESTPLTSAESSRHLAILGSCALGINNEEKTYYLAVKARKRASSFLVVQNKLYNFPSTEEVLYAVAISSYQNKKEAAALTALITSNGDIIFNFKVGYQVFSGSLFFRVFKNYATPTKKILFNPYKKFLLFDDIKVTDRSLLATLPSVSNDECAGHFDGFPMLPAGVLAYMAINTMESILQKVTNISNLRYFLNYADMDVISPISPDKQVELAVDYLGFSTEAYNFFWKMRDLISGEIFNTMSISFFTSGESVLLQDNTLRSAKTKSCHIKSTRKFAVKL